MMAQTLNAKCKKESVEKGERKQHTMSGGKAVPSPTNTKPDHMISKEEQKGDQTLQRPSRKRTRQRKEAFYIRRKINKAQAEQKDDITINSKAEESDMEDKGGSLEGSMVVFLEDLKRLHPKVSEMPEQRVDEYDEEAIEWVNVPEVVAKILFGIAEEEAPATGDLQGAQHHKLE
ncbi:hypothetical protein NDU88_009770 [Pleurodeles waltl]|uniref:Uncharacterized protein n=1 Tax=Pleurodeles waltl TaxID=8319 RepID=A0AAV7QSJ2_PLEWA|nr:hypothetical protein NDU88_009770 [Pleurodeles waltl]